MTSRWIIEKDVSSDWFLCKGNEISAVDSKKCQFPAGRRINVMLNDPPQPDQQADQDSDSYTQWKFSVRSVAAIGLTTDQSYGPGYSIKGFIYDSRGNLRTSGTDLVTQFGDKWPEASEIVLITNESVDNHLKIWIIQDHRPLGLALSLNYPLKGQLKPFLTFNKLGKCLIHRSTWKGNLETIERPHNQQLNGSIIGYWQLVQFNSQIPLRPHEATIIRRSDYIYELIMSGWNKIDVELMFSKGSVYRVKNKQKTTLGGPDEWMVEERKIFGAFVGTININLTENGMKMIIKTDQVSLKFNRCDKAKPNPIEYNPFVKSTDPFLETEIL